MFQQMSEEFPVQMPFPIESNQPIYKALAEAFCRAIRDGSLAPGQMLPSVRALAANCGVSTDTAVRCYEELLVMGLIETKPKMGTFIRRPEAQNTGTEQHPTLSDVADLPAPEGSSTVARLSPSSVALPVSTWQKLLTKHRCTVTGNQSAFEYDSFPSGVPELQSAISAYLLRARALHCKPRQILIMTGSRLDFVARLLLGKSDTVAVPNPCYPTVQPILESHDARIIEIPCDQDGMRIDTLPPHTTDAKIIYTSPFHHDPSGAALPEQRRRELLHFATEVGAFVFESDVDHYFVYGRKSFAALRALDSSDRVIYSSSFWPVLGRLARIGFLVIPEALVEEAMRLQTILGCGASILEQHVLAEFIRDRHLDRHILKMNRLYGRRRRALIEALVQCFREGVSIGRSQSGTQLLVRFNSISGDAELAEAAARAGLSLTSTRNFYRGEAPCGEFLIAFSSIDDGEIAEAMRQFRDHLSSTD